MRVYDSFDRQQAENGRFPLPTGPEDS